MLVKPKASGRKRQINHILDFIGRKVVERASSLKFLDLHITKDLPRAQHKESPPILILPQMFA